MPVCGKVGGEVWGVHRMQKCGVGVCVGVPWVMENGCHEGNVFHVMPLRGCVGLGIWGLYLRAVPSCSGAWGGGRVAGEMQSCSCVGHPA